MAWMLTCGVAAAQDTGRIGLAMGYPPTVALVVRVSDSIAVRPEGTFTATSSTTTTSPAGTSNTSDSHSFGVGASALFYISKIDNLRTYLSPRFNYSRYTFDLNSTLGSGLQSRSAARTVSGSFGAEYALGSRFTVFAELGIAYSRETNEPTSSNPLFSSSSTGNSWSDRTAVGAILYFK
jgi:hypothetical protein